MTYPEPQLLVTTTPREFGVLFRRERQALGMTQAQVAESVGCSRQRVAALERGESVSTLTLFKAVAAIRKSVSLRANRPELEEVRGFLLEH